MDDKRTFRGRQGRMGRAGERAEAQDYRRNRQRVRAQLSAVMRGLLFCGAGYLLGATPLALGAVPFGLALLAASTGCTWYIAAGTILSAWLHPGSLHPAAWTGVYALCILLRLAALFFIDPPSLPGEQPEAGVGGTLRYAARFIGLCLRSAWGNLGWSNRHHTDTNTDYYTGSPWERGKRAGATTDGPPDDATEDALEEETLPPPLPAHLHLFSEHPFLRALCGALCGFAAGTICLFMGGIHVYDLLSALIMVFVTPAATILFTACFGSAGETLLFSRHPLRDASGAPGVWSVGGRNLIARFHLMPLISCAGLLFSLCFCARDMSFALGTPYLTIHTGVLLATLFTLSATSRLGLLPGLAVALLVGVGTGADALPLFLLMAAIYAFLRSISHPSAVLGGVVAGGIWCAAMSGLEGFLWQLPTLCVSAPLFFLFERLWDKLPLSTTGEEQAESDFVLAVTGELRLQAGRERLESLSQALLDMSSRLAKMGTEQEMACAEKACRMGILAVCTTCRDRTTCQVSEQIEHTFLSRIRRGQRPDTSALPAELTAACTHTEVMVSEIDHRLALMTEEQVRGGKTEVMALDYAHMAHLLADAAAEDPTDTYCNRVMADRVYEYLSGLGVAVQGVVVCGRRERRVIVRGSHMERLRAQAADIAGRLGDLCEARLSAPTFEGPEEACIMTLCSLPGVTVKFSGSTIPADHDGPIPPPLGGTMPGRTTRYTPPPVCGDHIAIFRNDRACFYALISDGMGSGETASAVSEICAAFLERMLSAGSRVEISMRMLNSFLCARGSDPMEECSATVDLMELDTAYGHAVFAKSGAAPTYVIRNGTVYKLRSKSQPLGILHDSRPQLLRFRMHPGDVVVMVSDGVTRGNDECPWLLDLLSDPLPESMDSLRVDILRRAMASGSPDDLSAIAIRIDEPKAT